MQYLPLSSSFNTILIFEYDVNQSRREMKCKSEGSLKLQFICPNRSPFSIFSFLLVLAAPILTKGIVNKGACPSRAPRMQKKSHKMSVRFRQSGDPQTLLPLPGANFFLPRSTLLSKVRQWLSLGKTLGKESSYGPPTGRVNWISLWAVYLAGSLPKKFCSSRDRRDTVTYPVMGVTMRWNQTIISSNGTCMQLMLETFIRPGSFPMNSTSRFFISRLGSMRGGQHFFYLLTLANERKDACWPVMPSRNKHFPLLLLYWGNWSP